ncbi:MAG: hypothetical protein ACI89L_001952 [Phycisphaerales bacterium]|jgi:hypothetical protein
MFEASLAPKGLAGLHLRPRTLSREESIMSAGRVTRAKNKSAQKRQKVGSIARYKKKLALARRKKASNRVTSGSNN